MSRVIVTARLVTNTYMPYGITMNRPMTLDGVLIWLKKMRKKVALQSQENEQFTHTYFHIIYQEDRPFMVKNILKKPNWRIVHGYCGTKIRTPSMLNDNEYFKKEHKHKGTASCTKGFMGTTIHIEMDPGTIESYFEWFLSIFEGIKKQNEINYEHTYAYENFNFPFQIDIYTVEPKYFGVEHVTIKAQIEGT